MMAKENLFGKMGQDMQENLKIIKQKEKENGNIQMVIHMKEILKMGNSMDMELKKRKMGKYILEILKTINMKEKE